LDLQELSTLLRLFQSFLVALVGLLDQQPVGLSANVPLEVFLVARTGC